MTMPALAKGLGSRLPSADEKKVANHLRSLLAQQSAGQTKLHVLVDESPSPIEITLLPAISDLLMQVLRYIGSGDAVTLVPVSQMLTTQQAADILNVSRPFLVSLLEKKEIEYTCVGRHRRIKAEHLFAYKDKRAITRSDALGELAELDADLI